MLISYKIRKKQEVNVIRRSRKCLLLHHVVRGGDLLSQSLGVCEWERDGLCPCDLIEAS